MRVQSGRWPEEQQGARAQNEGKEKNQEIHKKKRKHQ
jgi:hypothetical protein